MKADVSIQSVGSPKHRKMSLCTGGARDKAKYGGKAWVSLVCVWVDFTVTTILKQTSFPEVEFSLQMPLLLI